MSFNELERKELIANKKEQIKLLEKEILELKQPQSIAAYVHNPMLVVKANNDGTGYDIWERKVFGGPAWDLIRKLCLELVKNSYDLGYGTRLSVKKLKNEDIHICAEMAEELIDVWNKHIEKVYGQEVEQ